MKRISACLLLGVTIFAVYANALDNEFVFDDYFMVVENRAIQLPVRELPTLFRFDGGVGSYRPMRTLSYVLDYHVGGLQPFVYHLFNVVYHWLTACLVFLVTLQLLVRQFPVVSSQLPVLSPQSSVLSPQSSDSELQTPNSRLRTPNSRLRTNSRLLLALGVALLWALHPIQTDSVTYISGRRDILAGLFFFLGFFAFLQLRTVPASNASRRLWTVTALVAFVCGALSKESALILPLVFFAYDLCWEYVPGQSLWRQIWRSGWSHKWLYGPFLLAAMGVVGYYQVYHVVILRWQEDNLFSAWATVPRIWMYYVQLLLLPATLNADYSDAFPLSSSIFEGRVLAALLGVLGLLLATGWALTRGHRLGAFCGLWFVITLLPVSQLLPHPELLAEHYLYLPSFGFCLFIGLGAGGWGLGASPPSTQVSSLKSQVSNYLGVRVGYGIVTVLLVSYSLRTIVRNRDWQDEVTLWRKTAITAPTSARAWHNLGVALQLHGRDLGEAKQAFQYALERAPTYGAAYSGLAELYLAELNFEDALVAAQKGVELRPRRFWSYWILGLVHYRRGEYPQALNALLRAVELNRDFTPVHDLVVLLYRLTGEEEKALEWQSRFPPSRTLPPSLIPGGLEGREDPHQSQ